MPYEKFLKMDVNIKGKNKNLLKFFLMSGLAIVPLSTFYTNVVNASTRNNKQIIVQQDATDLNKEDVAQDDNEAQWDLLRKQANEGDADAQYRVGRRYDDDGKYAEAADWYKKALEKDQSSAEVSLGYLYQTGRGVPQDDSEAASLYDKATKKGNDYGEMLLAYAYQDGRGVPQNYVKAANLFQKSEKQGNVFALVGLGYLYMRGWGVPLDFAKAAEYFHRAEDKGDVTGGYFLGIMARDGIGQDQNNHEAVKYFKKAADKGDEKACLALGGLYAYGKGVRQSNVQAIKYLEEAAAKNNTEAMRFLGWLYEDGKVTDEKIGDQKDLDPKIVEQKVVANISRAKEWYGKACDAGDEEGCGRYAWLNQNSNLKKEGMTSHESILQHYRKLADQNNSEAQFVIGHFYEMGQHVRQSYDEAKNWYGKACDNEYEKGCVNYARLNVLAQNNR